MVFILRLRNRSPLLVFLFKKTLVSEAGPWKKFAGMYQLKLFCINEGNG